MEVAGRQGLTAVEPRQGEQIVYETGQADCLFMHIAQALDHLRVAFGAKSKKYLRRALQNGGWGSKLMGRVRQKIPHPLLGSFGRR